MTLAPLQITRTVSRTFLGVVFGSLAGLGLIVGLLGLYLRSHLREQILSRDAMLIEAITTVEEGSADGLTEFDLVDGALAASELRGVLGLLVTDADGAWVANVPADLLPTELDPATRERATEEGAFAHFHEDVPLAALFDEAAVGDETVPLVEIVVPLRSVGGGRMFAQFWNDGQMIEREFASLDRSLLGQGLVAWLAATSAVLLVFGLAFGRLRRSGEALEQRTRELEAMNRELEMAARTAAVGSISAHLLHGLKSPLAGLRAYLRAHGDDEALETTSRMQQLVHETLRVLRGEARDGGRPVPLPELAGELGQQFAAALNASHAVLVTTGLPAVELSRRSANLLRLVLENLVGNALEAAAGPTQIELSGETRAEVLLLRMSDRSGGIPDAMRGRLFTPGATSKEGGSGLGLAISKQLMTSLQGDLVLERSDSAGSCFLVKLPLGATARRDEKGMVR